MISKRIVGCAERFPSPAIVMEKLTGIRGNFRREKKLDGRFHFLPLRELQKMIDYKARLQEIEVVYIDSKNTSKTCQMWVCYPCRRQRVQAP